MHCDLSCLLFDSRQSLQLFIDDCYCALCGFFVTIFLLLISEDTASLVQKDGRRKL